MITAGLRDFSWTEVLHFLSVFYGGISCALSCRVIQGVNFNSKFSTATEALGG